MLAMLVLHVSLLEVRSAVGVNFMGYFSNFILIQAFMWQQDTQAVSSNFFTPNVMIYVIFLVFGNFQKCFYSQVIMRTLSLLDLVESFCNGLRQVG